MRRRVTPEETALARARGELEAVKRDAATLLDDPTVTTADIRVMRTAVRDARLAVRRAANEIERLRRIDDRRACVEAAEILERARDVADWQVRAAEFRAQAADHDARLTVLADPIAAAIADDAAPRPPFPGAPARIR